MTKRLEEVFLVLLTVRAVVVFTTQGDQRQRNSTKEKPDHRGKTFLLSFLEMDDKSATSSIYVSCRRRGEVAVSFLGKNITRTVVPGVSTKISLPSGVRMAGFGKENKGILITSDVSISVYAMNARPYQSRDVHVVFPSPTLGTEHVAVTFTPQDKSLIGIIAMHDNTLVQIRLRLRPPGNVLYAGRTYRGGDVLRVVLNRLDTFQAQHGHDLTGTAVISSKPVAVLSGNICASVPLGRKKCSHLAMQVPSVSKWGMRFITTHMPGRDFRDLFRIVAAYNETLITVGEHENFSLDAGELRDLEFPITENKYITSSKPSMLVQFNKGDLGYVYSEPFTLLVPPIEQYGYEYDLVVLETVSPFETFISVVIETAQTQALFNTSLLENGKFKWKSINGTQYSTSSSQFSRTPYFKTTSIKCNSSTRVPFAVYMVGHSDEDGYGYLGGMTMTDINCNRLFPAGVGGGECGGKKYEKLAYVVSNCNASDVYNIPSSVYLKGAHFNDSTTTGRHSCEVEVNRTWYVRSPNGSAIAFAIQRIIWRKPTLNVTFPADARVERRNASALLQHMKPNVSSLCPLDNINTTYVDNIFRLNATTTLIRRLWTVREDCGRTVTGNQTILIHVSSKVNPTTRKNPFKEKRKKLGFVLGLSVGFAVLGLIVTVLIVARIWKLHASRCISTTSRVDTLQAQNQLSHYTNTVAITENNDYYSEIKIESLSEEEK